MTHMTVPSPGWRRYGFNVYKSGVLVREQIVFAGSAAIAEVKVWRYLAPDEYVWYAEPRLIEDDEQVVEVLDEDEDPEAEEAA